MHNYYSTFAPMQTRGEPSYSKTIPVLLSRVLYNTFRYNTGKYLLLVDSWNSVGRKIDLDYRKEQARYKTRQVYNKHKIEANRAFFKQFNIANADLDFLDCNQESETTIKKLLLSKYNKGIIKKELFTGSYCNVCNLCIAPLEAGAKKCNRCNSTLVPKNAEGLFWYIESRALKNGVKIIPEKLQSQFNANFRDIPKKILISKDRDFGIDLGEFGVNQVLDPKIGISLMPTVLLETSNVKPYFIVHGHGVRLFSKYSMFVVALNDVTPKYFVAHNLLLFDIKDLPNGIPAYDLKNQDLYIFTSRILPILLLEENLDKETTLKYFTEFRNLRTKIRNIKRWRDLRKDLPSGDLPTSLKPFVELDKINCSIKKYNLTLAYSLYRNFIHKTVSRELIPYINERQFSPENLWNKIDILNSFFGI